MNELSIVNSILLQTHIISHKASRMEQKMGHLTQIGDVLKQRIIGVGEGPVLKLFDLVRQWPQVIGETFSEKAFPMHLRAGTLTLQATSPSWANELQLMSPSLLDKIRRACPSLKIQRLKFIV